MNKNNFLNYIKGKSILITGGTGSFGNFFTKTILKKYYSQIKKLLFTVEMN